MKKGKKIAYFILWLAAFLFCAISQAVFGHWMAFFYCVMFYVQCIPLSVLVGRIRASEGEIDRLRQMLRDEWTEKRAREQYDRMAPIYGERDSFEVALHGAWRFYEKSGAMLADACEDNRTELIFSKGFREGVLYGKKTGGRQNPAKWNDADDKIHRNLMSLLSCMRGDRIAEETYKKYYPWLRDLPKRFNLQREQPECGCSEKPNNLLSEKSKHPEVDLEKEIRAWLDSGIYTIGETARHFYELGLKARK